jgi:hypothetical protein
MRSEPDRGMVVSDQPQGDLAGGVAAAVVDDDHLEIRDQTGHNLEGPIDGRLKILVLVVGGQDDRDSLRHGLGHRGPAGIAKISALIGIKPW